MTIEKQIIELIATDRIDVPISSMSGKLKRAKPKLGKAIDLSRCDKRYLGDRVYARLETNDTTMKARAMSEAIDQFSDQYPRHGAILKGLIEEERAARETNLYFGIREGCRLTADDYLGVMQSLGFTENAARDIYPQLMDASRRISRKRDEERSVLIGSVFA
jgi:hypothetical protein